MPKKMKITEKRDTFIYKGLGFPIKLINVPMKKQFGKWCININFNKLMLLALVALAHKPAALNGGELRFIRTYLDMTTTAFGKLFGVSHAAVIKWESGKSQMSPSIDAYIRLFIMDHIKASNEEFRNLFSKLNLEKISKSKSEKLIEIDGAANDLKMAV